MKSILVLLACAAALSAQTAEFVTGQAARLVIGQPNFTAQDPNSSDVVLGGVSGLAFAGDTLFVADSNRVGASPTNHRVLLYKGASTMFPNPGALLPLNSKCPACVGQATLVLGQPNFTTTTENLTASASGLRLPTAVASDGVRLVVADTNHNRLLIWNRIPTINNQPADVVVGQPDFTTRDAAAGHAHGQDAARTARRVDSERPAVRGRYAEQPRADLQPDSHGQRRRGGRGAGRAEFHHLRGAGPDAAERSRRRPPRC